MQYWYVLQVSAIGDCGIVVLKHLLIQTEMKVDNANEKEVMRLLQYLTMVLMSMYGHRDLVKKATVQVWLFSYQFC